MLQSPGKQGPSSRRRGQVSPTGQPFEGLSGRESNPLRTVQLRWGVPSLTARDAAAPDVSAALSLHTPRTDDPLAGVSPPTARGANPAAGRPSHLQQVYAELVAALPVPDAQGGTAHAMPAMHTEAEYDRYIQDRLAGWKAARRTIPE